MRKTALRIIGMVLAVIMVFLSVGEALPAYAEEAAQPNEIEDHYEIKGITYYNAYSKNIASDKLFYEDLINHRSDYLDGYTLGELWMMVAIGIIPDDQFSTDRQNTESYRKDLIESTVGKKDPQYFPEAQYISSRKRVEESVCNTFGVDSKFINVSFTNFKLSPLLPDASFENNYVSSESGYKDKNGDKAAQIQNKEIRDVTATITQSEGGSVSLSSTVSHSSSYTYEEGVEIGAEEDFVFAKVSEKVSFKATQAVQDGWSNTKTNTQNYNNSESITVTVPAHSVMMVQKYTTDASVLTRYNCPVALTYDVEIGWGPLPDYAEKNTKFKFGSNARTNLNHRAFEEGVRDGHDDEGITWSKALNIDEIKKATELITTHVPMSGTGASFTQTMKAEGFKIDEAMPMYPLERIKLMPPGYSFIENKQVDYNNLQYYTANMKIGDSITPDSLVVKGYDRDDVPYCKFAKACGGWYIGDENGKELEESEAPVVLKKGVGQARYQAVKTGTCYLIYRIDEEKAKYNSYESEHIYATNESLKSTAALKLVVGSSQADDAYTFKITGGYIGSVGAEVESIEGEGKLSATVKDKSGKEVEYKWKSTEKKEDGIDLAADGTVTFSKAGTYHVKVYVEDSNYESEPVEIRAEEVKAEITAPKPAANVYDGTEKELVTAGSIEGDGRMVYALSQKDSDTSELGFSEQIPQATDAGEYKVWYKAVDASNKDLTTEACVTAFISKAEYKGETKPNVTMQPGETEKTIDLTAFLPKVTTGLTLGEPVTDGLSYKDKPAISKGEDNDKYELSYALSSETTGTGSITIPVKTDNYEDYNITITIRLSAPFVKEPVSSVTLSSKKLDVGTGETVKILADVLPRTAVQKLEWAADNENVEVIMEPDTQAAYVTGKKAGTAKVTATATDGSRKKAVCSVKVGTPVGDFKIFGKNGAKELAVGKSLPMAVGWSSGKPQNSGIIWQVDDDFAATISDKGVLTGRHEGVVKVYAISRADQGIIRTCDITVYNPVKKAGLSATKGVVSRSSNAKALVLSAYASGVEDSMIENSATGATLGQKPSVKFSVDDKYKDYLTLTPVKDDSTSVMITAAAGNETVRNIPVKATIKAYNNYEKTLTCKVTVQDANPLKKLKLNKKKLSVGEGCIDDTLTVSLDPVNPDGAGVEWTSSAENVATVAGNGAVKGLKAGTAVITAKAGGIKASCNVTVTPKITQLTLTNKDALTDSGLAVGKTFRLNADTGSGSGKSSSGIEWISTNDSVATVDKNGVVKALKPGRVWIFATVNANAEDFNDMKYELVDLTTYIPVKSIKLDKSKMELSTVGDNRYGKITVVKVLPETVDNRNIKWTAGSPIVRLAAISEYDGPTEEAFSDAGQSVTTGDGQVLAVMGEATGTVTITGVAQDGSNKKVTCKVIVR